MWLGSAFDDECSSGEISLRHVYGDFETAHGRCNSISAHGVSAANNYFTSELRIAVKSGLNGRTVTCLYDDSSSIQVVGNNTISFTNGNLQNSQYIYKVNEKYIVNNCICFSTANSVPLSSPKTISLNDVSSDGQLIFSWSSVVQNCPSIQYNVNTTDCGVCPDNTADTNLTCTTSNVSSIEQMCSFSVQTVVCDNIAGEVSAPLTITLKGI